MNKMRRGWFIVPIVLLLSACAPANGHIELPQQYRLPQAPLAATFERRSGRIALLDANGDLVIMDQTGGNVVKITTDANAATAQSQSAPSQPSETTYHYPVWSPDASQIAFVEMTAEHTSTSRVIELGADSVTVQRGEQSVTIQQGENGSSIHSAPNTMSVASQPSRVIIENSTGGAVIASTLYLAHADGKAPLQELYNLNEGALGYPDWSPDGSQLAFLSQAQRGVIDLNVVAKEAGKPRQVLSGAATTWNWRSDGQALVARVDTSTSQDTSDLVVWDAQTGKPATPLAQNVSLPFDAPAYSPDGNAMLITVKSGGRNYLALADRQGNVMRKLAPIVGHINYVWSPGGTSVAYIDTAVSADGTDLSQAPTGGTLHVLDVNTGVDRLMTQLPVTSFFWSPDGQRLATFTPVQLGQMSTQFPGLDLTSKQPSSVFILQTINVSTRQARQLFYLEPTDEFSTLLDHFDRTSHSATLWSPDSNHLVLSIIDANQQPTIIETEATGSVEPRVLSKGTLAVWSPR
jgi:Tol biopolymer transport system component